MAGVATPAARDHRLERRRFRHCKGSSMNEALYPKPTRALSERRSALAPKVDAAFQQFNQAVFQDGALSRKSKQLIAVAIAHVTQCPYCIRGHAKAAARAGATPEEVMEAIWVAAEIRAGGAFAHSALALDALDGLGHAESRID
jgi:AhpD family alkylhydroperoxidase